jgi:hypothetical protein
VLDELKRRRDFRGSVVYAATAFVVPQAADLLASGLALPSWVFTAATQFISRGRSVRREDP